MIALAVAQLLAGLAVVGALALLGLVLADAGQSLVDAHRAGMRRLRATPTSVPEQRRPAA